MKRVMTTSVVAGLLGTLGFAPAVSADFTLYGSVRSGVYIVNPDGPGDTTWDLGTVDSGALGPTGDARVVGARDKLWSRIGVRASTEIDGGLTAGAHIEKRLDSWLTRHQNVFLSGDFGRITLGQQGSPYYSGVSWDGANFFGGSSDPGSRQNGIRFDSNLGGPFGVSAMVVDDDSGTGGQGNGVDGWEVSGSLAAGPVSIGVGYKDQDNDLERMGVTLGGSFGDMGWEIGYETSDAMGTDDNDGRYGFFVDYSLGSGAVYLSYEDLDVGDGSVDSMGMARSDNDWTIVGYSHTLAPGVSVIAEHRTPDSGNDISAVVLVVGF